MKKRVGTIFFTVVLMLTMNLSMVQAEDVIKIGVVGPMTGAAALNGQYMKNAVDLAAEEWNEKGGLLGSQIEIFYEDDQATANLALTAVNKQIYDNEVFALIGPHNSGCVLSVEGLCKDEEVVLLTGGTSPKIKDVGNEWVFRIRASDTLSAQLAYKYASEELGAEKIGMMYINNDFGTGGLGVVQQAAQDAGKELAAVEGFNPGDKDMSGQLLKMKEAGAEAVICWADDAEGAIIARQYKEYGLEEQFKIIGSATFSLAQWYATVDADIADGIYSVNDFVPTNEDADVQEFNEKYGDKYGISTDLYSAAYYDAANILFTAIEKAGEADAGKVRETLSTMEAYDGVMATSQFDEYRDGIHQILVVQNEGLTPKVVDIVKE